MSVHSTATPGASVTGTLSSTEHAASLHVNYVRFIQCISGSTAALACCERLLSSCRTNMSIWILYAHVEQESKSLKSVSPLFDVCQDAYPTQVSELYNGYGC